MPAVQLARLKEQINQLAWHFTRPQEFQRELQDLLDFYADRTYRPGQAIKPRPLIPIHHIAPIVQRQLEQDLGRLCQEHPAAALALVDLLWQDPYLEPRLLAAALLGQTPLQPADEILSRLLAWATPDLDDQLLDALLGPGSRRVRSEVPERWLTIIESWLSDLAADVQVIGLHALLPIIQDRSFENLPRIYRILSPVLQSAPAVLQNDLVRNLEALGKRAPAETAYFLRQMLNVSSTPVTVRLVRKCLPAFPKEAQDNLRRALLHRPGALER